MRRHTTSTIFALTLSSLAIVACAPPSPSPSSREPRAASSSAIDGPRQKTFSCSCVEVACTIFGKTKRLGYQAEQQNVTAFSSDEAEAMTIAAEQTNAETFCQIENPEMTAASCSMAVCGEGSVGCRFMPPSHPEAIAFCVSCNYGGDRVQTMSVDAPSEACVRELLEPDCGNDIEVARRQTDGSCRNPDGPGGGPGGGATGAGAGGF